MAQTGRDPKGNHPNKKDLKAEATRARICAAVIEILDREGYSETTLNRVQQAAGVSRGALTHHYPTRQALVCDVAVRLLEAAMTPLTHRLKTAHDTPPRGIQASLSDAWTKVVDTPEGRAFVEIVVASRTDQALHDTLQATLFEWDQRSSATARELYQGSGPEADDAALLWSICRSFLRGLLIHRQFVEDPAQLTRMIARFSEIMAAHMHVRGGQPDQKE